MQPPGQPAPGAAGAPEANGEANGDAAHVPGARGGDVSISVDASPPAPLTPDVRAPRPAAPDPRLCHASVSRGLAMPHLWPWHASA